MIVATGPLRDSERQRLLNRPDVCAIVDHPALAELRHVKDREALHYMLSAWFTGQLTWIVYYAH